MISEMLSPYSTTPNPLFPEVAMTFSIVAKDGISIVARTPEGLNVSLQSNDPVGQSSTGGIRASRVATSPIQDLACFQAFKFVARLSLFSTQGHSETFRREDRANTTAALAAHRETMLPKGSLGSTNWLQAHTFRVETVNKSCPSFRSDGSILPKPAFAREGGYCCHN